MIGYFDNSPYAKEKGLSGTDAFGESTWDDIPEDYWSEQLEVLLGEVCRF